LIEEHLKEAKGSTTFDVVRQVLKADSNRQYELSYELHDRFETATDLR
jgi:hypothetical protein